LIFFAELFIFYRFQVFIAKVEVRRIKNMSFCINPECRQRANPDSAEICQNCGTSLLINNHAHPSDININEHRYRIIKSLRYNPSTCTEIFEVEDLDPSDGQKFKILKTIHDNGTTYGNNQSLFEVLTRLFTREQNFLYFNHHSGIPRGYDIFSFSLSSGKTLHCLVMEKIQGVNLEQWVQNNKTIQEKRALEWLKQIVKILGFVHEEEFFHRDIKPSNIMWRQSDNKLMLIDFGAVKEINGIVINQNGITTTTRIGSPGYMAPEQSQGQPVPQSDFYALGRTFVYLLTGKLPQEIENQGPISRWPEFINNGRISRSFIQLINDLMEELPNRRPQNTQSILARIDRIQEGNKFVSPPSGQPRNQWWGWLMGAAIVSGAIGLLVVLIPRLFPPVISSQNLNKSSTSPTPSPTNLLSEACDFKPNDNISCGEESVISQRNPKKDPPREKREGIEQFRVRNYADAEKSFQKAWEKQRDPETLIYFNNSKINNLINQGTISQQQIRTIAAVAPLQNIDQQPDSSNQGLEILRGVAQAQDEVIKKGIYLQVVIANDQNNKDEASKIADQLGKNQKNLGVIGHYSSSVTKAALPKYQANGLVLVSPASTSVELSNQANFYRTVPDDAAPAKAIVENLTNQPNLQKVAIFWSQGENFSESLKSKAEYNLQQKNVNQVENSEIFNLRSDNFNAKNALSEAKKQRVTAIILIPDAGVSKSLTNAYEVIKANTDPNLTIIGADTLYNSKTTEIVGKNVVEKNVARDKFVVAVSWHRFNNKQFSEPAEKLWRGKVSSLTATAYDATLVLTEAIKKNPSREGIKNVISKPDFRVSGGATGDIRFNGSDRANLKSTLLKVLPYCQQELHNDFVPVNYPGGNCISEH
jgi:eukaryotic-like serine/threonine-protein kinase